jgi:hypothetical protein
VSARHVCIDCGKRRSAAEGEECSVCTKAAQRTATLAALRAIRDRAPLHRDTTLWIAAHRCEQLGYAEFYNDADGRARLRVSAKGSAMLAAVEAFGVRGAA